MIIPIQKIKKFLFYPSMCARVYCLWIAKFDGQYSNFNCILLIISGKAIQGSTKARDIPFFNDSIAEDEHYEIYFLHTSIDQETWCFQTMLSLT
ncbi:hypothetical protein NC651_018131 [Populus alba x Populus x berolinensis]|nr:hypothetical protein NC651_018131 [Populus alba x Populus x berolinensis]